MSKPVLLAGLAIAAIVPYQPIVSHAADSGSSAPTVCDCLGGIAQIAATSAALAQYVRIYQTIVGVAVGLGILGVIALAVQITLSVRRNIPRPSAVYFPIILSVTSVFLFAETFTVQGHFLDVTKSSLFGAVLRPFEGWPILLTLFPGLATAIGIVSVSRLWARVIVGLLVSAASTFLFQAISHFLLRDLVSSKITLLSIREIVVACLTGGALVFIAAGMNMMLASATRRRWLGGIAATVAAVGIVVWVGWWLFVHSVEQRVVTDLQRWERITLTPMEQIWGVRKVTVKAKWLMFTVTDDGFNLRAGAAAPRWQPTRLEIRRFAPPNLDQAARVEPFQKLPGSVVYATDIPDPVMQFRSPARQCVIVGRSMLENGIDLELTLTPRKRIQFSTEDPERTDWPSIEQQTRRPSTVAIDFSGGPGDVLIKSHGSGVVTVFCYAVTGAKDASAFGLLGDEPIRSQANREFEPKAIGILKLVFHPGAIISVGRFGEVHDLMLSAKATRVAFESSALRFEDSDSPFVTPMPIGDLQLEGPKGQMQIGRTQYSLEPSQDIGVGGDALTIRRSATGGVRIDGKSSRVVINGNVLSKTGIELLPQWVQTNLLTLILVLSNLATFVWGFLRGRRRDGGKNSLQSAGQTSP